jgi:hypothetical protein
MKHPITLSLSSIVFLSHFGFAMESTTVSVEDLLVLEQPEMAAAETVEDVYQTVSVDMLLGYIMSGINRKNETFDD